MRYILIIALFCSWSVNLLSQQKRIEILETRLKANHVSEKDKLSILLEVAKTYRFVDMSKSRQFAEEAIQLSENLDDDKSRVLALAIKGKAEMYLGNLSQAKIDLETALDESLRLNDLQGQLHSHIGLGFMAYWNAQAQSIMSELETATRIAKSLGDSEAQIELCLLRSFMLSYNEEHSETIEACEQGLLICSATNSPNFIPALVAARSYGMACLGNLDSARVELESAIEAAKTSGNIFGLEALIGNMGTTYWLGSNMHKAIEYYLAGKTYAEQLQDNLTIMQSISNLAKIYAIMEDYPKELGLASNSLVLARKYGCTTMIMDGLSVVSHATRLLNQQEICIQSLMEMSHIADSLGDKIYQLEVSLQLADTYNYFNIPDLALPNAIRCVQQAITLDDASTLSRAYLAEGSAIFAASDEALIKAGIAVKDRFRLALKNYQAVISNQTEFLDRMAYTAYAGISEIYERQGKFEDALIYFKKAKTVHDSLINAEKNDVISGLQIAYDTEKKESEILLLGKETEEQSRKIQQQRNLVKGLIGVGTLLLMFATVFFTQRNRISKEKRRSEDLLLNILPEEVADELKAKGSADAQMIDQVTVLFTDFKGFTQLSEKLSPKALVAEINECFSAFDHIMTKYGIEKIKTIGDAYMAAGGLPTPNSTHANDVVNAAVEIQAFMQDHKKTREAAGELFFEIRIGIHTGPVVAGIVGVKKFQYDIWGDTVNTASRMESSGEVGEVNISETTYELVKNDFTCQQRGMVQAKGKGEMKMYFVKD